MLEINPANSGAQNGIGMDGYEPLNFLKWKIRLLKANLTAMEKSLLKVKPGNLRSQMRIRWAKANSQAIRLQLQQQC